MRLTRFSDIGLRVLIYLARATEDRMPITVAEVAKQFEIPLNHLVKVVGQLARAGWVNATRGRNGGIRLCVQPETLSIGAVLRELEGDSELVDCEAQKCRLNRDCQLRAAFNAGLRAFYDTMDHYSLADITRGGTGDQVVRMHKNFLRQVSQAEV
jgi:Rrf2 family nitric oxide-sensitive transcriptional repressor